MGKFAKALEKSARDRQAARLSELTREDLAALVSYDCKTGHLISDETGGGAGNNSMDVLRNRGTLQRLLDHKLIFPGGKLTPKGLSECERLTKRIRMPKTAVNSDIKSGEPIIEEIESEDVIIELEEEVNSAEPAEGDDSSFKKVTLLKRPTAPKLQPVLGFDAQTAPAEIRSPGGTDVEVGRQEDSTAMSDHKTDTPAKPEKPLAEEGGASRPFVAASGISSGKKIHKNLVSLLNPQSYEAEQFKILRNNILFPVEGEAPRSILVTSCQPGEGKSFVAANLAVSIAMNVNKHVLLLDCDLRKPDLHHIFGLRDETGLSDYLAENNSLASLLQRTDVERLTLLPGGPVPVNPSELMSSERMAEMLDEVERRYSDRLIVIDSPPPGLAAETSYLARQVDGILLVVKYGKTPREDVADLMEMVGSEKILGVVINYLDMPGSRRYGYGKYGKYGSYGYGKK